MNLSATIQLLALTGSAVFLYSCNGIGGMNPDTNSSTANTVKTAITISNEDDVHYTIFSTSLAYGTESLATLAAADAICNQDERRPPDKTSSYKALLGANLRYGCTQTGLCGPGGFSKDWVLQPETSYYSTLGSVIATTNLTSVFTFNLTNPISNSDYMAWTGLDADWQSNKNNCNAWKGGEDTKGRFGAANSLNLQKMISSETECCEDSCSDTPDPMKRIIYSSEDGSKSHLYCVQQ